MAKCTLYLVARVNLQPVIKTKIGDAYSGKHLHQVTLSIPTGPMIEEVMIRSVSGLNLTVTLNRERYIDILKVEGDDPEDARKLLMSVIEANPFFEWCLNLMEQVA